MTWLPVDVQADHLETLVKGDPLTGVTELVWNAIDAEAENVRVVVAESTLGGVEEVRIEDDGHGMTRADIDSEFAHLGGSWKRHASGSKNGKRILHGKEGKGRWRAFTIGPLVEWTTVGPSGEPRERSVITGSVEKLGGFEVSDPETVASPSGTVVRVTCAQPGPAGLLGDKAPKLLTATFALHLQRYNDTLTVTYRGAKLDPSTLQVRRETYDLDVPAGHGAGKLTVIEWSEDVDVKRGLFLCDQDGVVLDDMKAGIQARGFEFTAYAQWNGFLHLRDQLWHADTDEVLAPVIEAAKDLMREHFKLRRDENRRTIVQGWKDQQVYPFHEEPEGAPTRATRDLFDVVAVTAASAVNSSEDPVARRLSLTLIREALESNPTSLRRVLTEVLQLPQESLDELNSLLDQTTLTEIISASKLIASRLDFIEALRILVFEPKLKNKLKERSQLHRILAGETWIFGEEFNLTVDDQTLTSALKQHIKLLGREQLDDLAPVLDEEGKHRVIDLLLARRIEVAQNRREHLVVELKAPDVKVGADEITQIKKYAYTVADDSRFNMTDVRWDFVVVSSDLSAFAQKEASQALRPPGLVADLDDGRVRVWVKTWAQIIGEAEHRHKFVREALQYSPAAEQELAYLREVHAKFIPSELHDNGSDGGQSGVVPPVGAGR
jgi:hypothetical protein